MNEQESKQLWKEQPVLTSSFSIEDIKRQANVFQRRVRMRNLIEYIAAVYVISGFSFYIWAYPFLLMRIGSVLIILGVIFTVCQLHNRGSSRRLPNTSTGISCLEFHRAEMVRQRDALRKTWLWYVAPFAPGVLVFRWGVETEIDGSSPFSRGLTTNLMIFAVALIIFGINQWSAHRLQRKIDYLDSQASGQD